jgi:hypothetical protein
VEVFHEILIADKSVRNGGLKSINMGYYLPPKSYLRPKPSVNVKQKIIAITTVSITVIATIVIFITLHFTDTKSVLANTDSDKQNTHIVAAPILINPSPATIEKPHPVDYAFPVQLAYFKIVKEDIHSLVLKWSTTFEYKNAFYTIEKSTNGTTFNEVGCVESEKNHNLSNDYSYTDDIDGNTIVYYRLRQTSENDRSTYIALDKINLSIDEDDLSLYIDDIGPEPFDKFFNVNYFTSREGGISVEIFDKTGKKIFKTYTQANEGYNTCRFVDGDKLTDDVYTVRIANSNAAFIKKVKKKA